MKFSRPHISVALSGTRPNCFSLAGVSDESVESFPASQHHEDGLRGHGVDGRG